MAEKHNLVYLMSILALLLGVGLGSMLFAIEKPVIVKEPVVVEVQKTVEVEKIVTKDYLGQGIDEFLYNLENNPKFDKHLICNKDRYDFEQISVSRVDEDFNVESDIKDTDDKQNAKREILEFEVRLKYSDADVQEKCYKTFDVKVESLEGEESKVSVR